MLFSKVSTEFFSFRHYSSDIHFFNANESILHGQNILVMVPKQFAELRLLLRDVHRISCAGAPELT